MQRIIVGHIADGALERVLLGRQMKRALLVCGGSFHSLPFSDAVLGLPQIAGVFSGFEPNPAVQSAIEGARVFQALGCDSILAVGGGSAMDVAKCIRLMSGEQGEDALFLPGAGGLNVPLVAVPTTAGTGSESTRFAVLYRGVEKLSVERETLLPDTAILDASALCSLPVYQKKCALLDAVCQAVESFWSVNAGEESQALSERALHLLLSCRERYLAGEQDAARDALIGANLSGQAINLTRTTAAHAMSYRLTKLYHLPHGHAAAVCLPGVWRYIAQNTARCSDQRGEAYLKDTLSRLARIMGCADSMAAAKRFEEMLREMDILPPALNASALDELADSVNAARLGNTPVMMDRDALYHLYAQL